MPHAQFLEGLPCYNKQNFKKYFDDNRGGVAIYPRTTLSSSRSSIYTAISDDSYCADDDAVQIITENSYNATISYLYRQDRQTQSDHQARNHFQSQGRHHHHQSSTSSAIASSSNRRRTTQSNSTFESLNDGNHNSPGPISAPSSSATTSNESLRTVVVTTPRAPSTTRRDYTIGVSCVANTQQHPPAVLASTPVSTRKRKANNLRDSSSSSSADFSAFVVSGGSNSTITTPTGNKFHASIFDESLPIMSTPVACESSGYKKAKLSITTPTSSPSTSNFNSNQNTSLSDQVGNATPTNSSTLKPAIPAAPAVTKQIKQLSTPANKWLKVEHNSQNNSSIKTQHKSNNSIDHQDG